MKITYDPTIKIAGLAIVPWNRLGLQKWLPNYQIIAQQGFDTAQLPDSTPIIPLAGQVTLARRNIQHLVLTKAFDHLLHGEFKDYRFLPFRPITLPDEELRDRFLMVDPRFTRTFENKVWLRQYFGTTLPFASYKIVKRAELKATHSGYQELTVLGPKLVFQHEQLNGGKGTHIVSDFSSYLDTLSKLPETGNIVVSTYIEGQERSLQACATRYGVMVGDLQKQIIRASQLSNLHTRQVNSFGGAEIGTETNTSAIKTAQNIARTIGDAMYSDGYRGIFGVDVLISGDKVFILEVNARSTGVTPLINMVAGSKQLPFYLLHVLELGGYPYKIEDMNSEPMPPGSLLILHNQTGDPRRLVKCLPVGIYRFVKGQLELVRRGVDFGPDDAADSFLLQPYVPDGGVVKPGERLLAVILRRAVLDNVTDEILPDIASLIKTLYSHCQLEAVEFNNGR